MLRSRLTSVLRARGVSLSDLAHEIGATATAVGRIAAGTQVPSLTYALRMSLVLGVEVEDLFVDFREGENSCR